MKTKTALLILLSLILLLSSCSASWHLQRAKAKGAEVAVDTVYVTKEIIVPEVKTDTIFKATPGDTVHIVKDKLRIKYVKLPGDSVFIEGKCEADTVRLEVPVSVVTKIKAKFPWVWILVAFVAGVILALFKRT